MAIRSPVRSKYQARVQPVRGRILPWPLYPVFQQIAPISLSLLRDENAIRIQSFAPKDNSSAIRREILHPGPSSIE